MSQNIFFKQRAKSNEQRAESNGQPAEISNNEETLKQEIRVNI